MTSIITILHGEKEFIPLIKYNFKNFNDQVSLELIIVDDGAGGTNRKAALSRVLTLTDDSATALSIALG